MSYCRWSDGDVYAYQSVVGGVWFWVSSPEGESLNRLCRTYNEAYQYAKLLRDVHGLNVPDYAIEALRADAIEEADHICGPDGAVADLCKENKTLRKLVDGWDFCSKTKTSTFDECVGCPLFEQSPHGYRCTRSELMRELGIEVD